LSEEEEGALKTNPWPNLKGKHTA